MQRVSVHDPSIVYEEATKRYYIFGTHKAGAYTTNLQSWTQANPKWKVGSNNQEIFIIQDIVYMNWKMERFKEFRFLFGGYFIKLDK